MAYIPQGITSIVNTVPSSVQVGASIMGQLPAGTAPIGSVATLQGTNPWITNINHSVATVIIGGSIATSSPANQSVSGTVNTLPLGTIITSLVSTVPSSVIVGASIFGLPPVNVTNTNLNVGGSVVSYQTVPSSMLVGASIFGQLPAGTAPLGSVATLQGTVPWIISSVYGNISGSVVATQGTNPWVMGSIITVRQNATEFRYVGSLVSTSVTLIAASVAGKQHYITDFKFANTGSVSTLITFKDGSTSIIGYTIAPSGGGSNYPTAGIPDRAAAAQDLVFQPATAVSILYGTISGYTL